jgi:hypothetical protein
MAPNPEDSGPPGESKKPAKRRPRRPPDDLDALVADKGLKAEVRPSVPSLAVRMDALMREYISSLERARDELRTETTRLQGEVDRLGPENARLAEALGNAQANNVLATILIGLGGFTVSYATFTGEAATLWANAAAGTLVAGVTLMVFQTSRAWLGRK